MKKLLSICLAATGLISGLQAQSPCDSLPVVNIAVSNTTPCLGDSITLTANGALTYTWNNNVNNGVAFAPSISDTYQVVSIDSLGCSDTSSVFIDVLPLPDVVANSSSLSTCLGDSVQLTASGANNYTWVNPVINNGDFYTPADTGANIFTVEGTGSNGCLNTSQVIVVVKPIPEVPTLSRNSLFTCLDVAFDEQIIASVSEGRVFWYTDEALTQEYSGEPELIVPNNPAGSTLYYASNFDGGCYSPGVPAGVNVFALPVIDAGTDITLNATDRGNLNAEVPTGSTLNWWPETGLSDPTSRAPIFTATNSETFLLTVTDERGCVSTDEVTVNVRPTLTISNVMTPNNDGNNDVWKIYPEVVLQTCNVRIFDGFGRVLLETDNYQNDWDGTYEGNDLPDGDYYYHLQCTDVEEKGTLIIIK